MKFNRAMDAVKRGKKVARRKWQQDKNLAKLYIWKPERFVIYNYGATYPMTEEDMLAKDWEIVDERMYLGSLMVKGGIVQIPEDPTCDGDMIGYNRPDIMITNTKRGFEIAWLHLKDNIYICDRGLINCVSWDTLEKAGYVSGKEVMIDGKRCRIRLMTGSNGIPGTYGRDRCNEWDELMDKYGENNNLTHYKNMQTWCQEADCNYSDYRSVRGYRSARDYCGYHATSSRTYVAFRPALEILTFEDGKNEE